MMDEAELLSFARDVLRSQPFSATMGTRLDAIAPGHAELSVAVTPALLQQHGFVHGGVLAYLADNTLTFAGGSVLGDALTVELKINYTRPARDCDRLCAVAHVADAGKAQAVCRCDIFCERGGERVLCAVAQGTIRKANAESARAAEGHAGRPTPPKPE
jgi:uncharacterized protein (TIGR00369 family)